MREAIGGAGLFYIIMIFLVIYIFFMSFVMNYASAYRASNYAISKIEEYEGNYNLDSINNAVDELYKYKNGFSEPVCCDNRNGSVYKLTAAVDFELPLVSINFKIPVKTETKTIYGVSCAEANHNGSECK